MNPSQNPDQSLSQGLQKEVEQAKIIDNKALEAARNRRNNLRALAGFQRGQTEQALLATEEIRAGVREAGLDPDHVRCITFSGLNPNGTVTIGSYNPNTGDIAIGNLEVLEMTRRSRSLREHAKHVAQHEIVHRTICVNAIRRGEFGLILQYLGAALYQALHEFCACGGSPEPGTSHVRLCEDAVAFADAAHLSPAELMDLMLQGRELDIVIAAIRSGHLEGVLEEELGRLRIAA